MKHSAKNINDLKGSDSFKKLNPQLFGNSEGFKKGKKREQRKANRLNKTETIFLNTQLEKIIGFISATTIIQPLRFFEMTGGGTYTPDFVVIHGQGMDVFEVKGGYKGAGWEQGVERYKRAAYEFDNEYINFYYCEFDRKNNSWDVQRWKDVKERDSEHLKP